MRLQDLHTHSSYSDGKNDVGLMVLAADVYGLDTIAITDHYSDRYAFNITDLVRDCEAAREWANCDVMVGVEAVITSIAGHVSVTDEVLPHLDLVLCELGPQVVEPVMTLPVERRAESLTRAMVNACRRNPCIRILAHPLNMAAIAGVDLNQFSEPLLDELATTCIETGVAFEVMSDQWWWFRHQPIDAVTGKYARIVSYMASKGVEFTLGSDAHSHQGVGNFTWARRVLSLTEVSEEQIAYIDRGSSMSLKNIHKTSPRCATCFLWLGSQREVRRGMPSIIQFEDNERATCRQSGLTRAAWHGGGCRDWKPWIR
ncbi:MAG: PHP domain-containing protein [Limnochordia bacterium]